MNKLPYFIIISAFLFSIAFAKDNSAQKPPVLSPDAANLLKPVLSEYLKAHDEEFDEAGRYRKKSPHEDIFEERFYKLLSNHNEAATEAIAALLCFYVGEHTAEELICESVRRSKTIKPYLLYFLDKPPITGLEPIKPFFTNIPNLRQEALDLINVGKKPSDVCIEE